MRVLFVTHNFPRFVGDVPGSFLLRLAEALQAAGAEVRVVAPSAPGLAADATLRGVRVTRFRYAPRSMETLAYTGNMAADVRASLGGKLALAGFLAAQYRAVRTAVREFRPDVVHAHWWFPNALVATWAARRVPLVTTSHGSDVVLARNTRALQPAFRRVVRKSAAITAVSSFLADVARALVPGASVSVAPMPVDVALFSPGGHRHRARFLFVGRLNRQKGIDDAIQALAAMPADAELDVVGDGPRRVQAHALADALGVGGRVSWHGAVAQGELLPLYRAATALLVPSTEEGLGLVAVEAALCGTPTIGYASGGLVDVVRDGETGALVPTGDTAAMAAAANALIETPARVDVLGGAGRADALDRFSPQRVAANYAALYARVTTSR